MIVTDYTRRALAYRRQKRRLESEGFIRLPEPHWPLVRGDQTNMKISEVEIGVDGRTLYIKLTERKVKS